MVNSHKKILKEKNLAIPEILFFTLYFFYILFFINPKIIYHSFGKALHFPEVFLDSFIIKECLSLPGGCVKLLSAYLSNLFYYPWLGSLIITCAGFGFYIFLKRLIKSNKIAKVLCFIPALLFLIIYNHYDHALDIGLAILIIMLAFDIYHRISFKNILLQILVFLFSVILLYYVTGGNVVLFIVLMFIYELLIRKRFSLLIVYISTGLIVPFIMGVYIFKLNLVDSFLNLTPFTRYATTAILETNFIIILLFFYFPFIVFLKFLLVDQLKLKGLKKPAKKSKNIKVTRFLQNNLILYLLTLFLFVPAIFVSFYGMRMNFGRIIYLADNNMWGKIINEAKKSSHSFSLPGRKFNLRYSPCLHYVYRALYETGSLADDLFSFPGNAESLLLFGTTDYSNIRYYIMSEICLQLGDLNRAIRTCHELLEKEGDSPVILERLAVIYIAKKQIDTARVYLNRMSSDITHGKKAKTILENLEKDPYLDGNSFVRHLRSFRWTLDYPIGFSTEVFTLKSLLLSNRENKMAFAYLMAYYLLTRNLDEFSTYWGVIKTMYKNNIPALYEEAFLLDSYVKRKNLDRISISSETINRFGNFLKITSKTDKKEIDRVLPSELKHTFFYYCLGR